MVIFPKFNLGDRVRVHLERHKKTQCTSVECALGRNGNEHAKLVYGAGQKPPTYPHLAVYHNGGASLHRSVGHVAHFTCTPSPFYVGRVYMEVTRKPLPSGRKDKDMRMQLRPTTPN